MNDSWGNLTNAVQSSAGDDATSTSTVAAAGATAAGGAAVVAGAVAVKAVMAKGAAAAVGQGAASALTSTTPNVDATPDVEPDVPDDVPEQDNNADGDDDYGDESDSVSTFAMSLKSDDVKFIAEHGGLDAMNPSKLALANKPMPTNPWNVDLGQIMKPK